MDPMEWRLPGVIWCAGNNCNSDPGTWPLHYARHQGVFNRLCSSCVLLSYRSMYCCGCFFLLGPTPPSQNDDPLVAPHEATVTCLVCHEAVAHLSCIDYSTVGVFVCPVCRAAASRMPFSYAPSCGAPLDMRGARVVLLSTRIALTLLQKEAAYAHALGKQLVVESMEERKEAYRALSLALGIDTEVPSRNKHIQPAKNLGKEPIDMAKPDLGKEPQIDMIGKELIDMAKLDLGKEPQIDMVGKEPIDLAKLDLGKEPQIDMANLDLNEPHIDMTKLDLNEPAPPPSPATLEVCMEDVHGGMAMASNEPPPPSVIRFTFGMDGLRREPAVASSSTHPPPSMSTFIFGMQGARRQSTMASTHQGPLPSLATESVRRELASSSTEPTLPSMAVHTLDMESVCMEFATASKLSTPKPRTLQLFSKDNDEGDEE
uniref:Uncharacterized protein n=1 Tax=Avena sativa TaxID=4498 RepID=A0ACD5VSD5_AVESA